MSKKPILCFLVVFFFGFEFDMYCITLGFNFGNLIMENGKIESEK